MYALLGGEAGVEALTGRFYDLMELEPQYAELRAQHGETLDYARERLFQFLSGWLGGPPLYEQAHGHPRLRCVDGDRVAVAAGQHRAAGEGQDAEGGEQSHRPEALHLGSNSFGASRPSR